MATVALVLTACTSDGDGDATGGAREVEFATAGAGDGWSDVAARLAPCADDDELVEFAAHLRAANPVVAETGLDEGYVVAFDPARVPAPPCVGDDTTASDTAASATEAGGSDADASASNDMAEPADAAPQEDDASADGGGVDRAGTDAAGGEASADGGAAVGGDAADGAVAESARGELTVAFEERFDEESSLDRFRWQIHHAPAFQGTPETWNGDHDLDCNPPPSVREVQRPDEGTDRGEVAYWCMPGPPESGHMMTTFRTTGYAQVAFAPDRSFVDVARVCWDQNMTDLGSRKWTQLVVIPDDVFVESGGRMDYVKPSLEEGPGAAGAFLTDDVFLLVVQTGSTVTHVGRDVYDEDFRGFTTLDKKRRHRICVEDAGDGTVVIDLEREDSVERRQMLGSFPDGPAWVVFQDDTYNSTKSPSPVDDPFTWHWDNLLIETG